MADTNHPATPRSMTLMAGPVDTSINPTAVDKLASKHPLEWFEQNADAHRAVAAFLARDGLSIPASSADFGLSSHPACRATGAPMSILVRPSPCAATPTARLRITRKFY